MTARKESSLASDARSQKIAATKAAKTEQFKSQTVLIDDNWRIIRADSLNWEIQYKGKFYGYFGDLCNAFRALPSKMLKESAKGTLADVLERRSEIVGID